MNCVDLLIFSERDSLAKSSPTILSSPTQEHVSSKLGPSESVVQELEQFMMSMDEAVAAMKEALWSDCQHHATILQLDFKDFSQNNTHPLNRYLASDCDPLSLFNAAGGKTLSVCRERECSKAVRN